MTFVPLASVASPDLLALAESIQFAVDAVHSGFSAQDQLLDYLSERSTLLVLDNFEHLVERSGFLSEVIERAPHVELLATSRERLNVQSEWVFDVEGLGLAEKGTRHLSRLDSSSRVLARYRPSSEPYRDLRHRWAARAP